MFRGGFTSQQPTMIERALRRIGYVKWRPASVIHRVDPGVTEVAPEINEAAKYAGVYLGSPWVYVAVNRIAEAAALVPFQVVAQRGEAIEDHPFERLLRRPNPLMSRFELIEQTVG